MLFVEESPAGLPGTPPVWIVLEKSHPALIVANLRLVGRFGVLQRYVVVQRDGHVLLAQSIPDASHQSRNLGPVSRGRVSLTSTGRHDVHSRCRGIEERGIELRTGAELCFGAGKEVQDAFAEFGCCA